MNESQKLYISGELINGLGSAIFRNLIELLEEQSDIGKQLTKKVKRIYFTGEVLI